MLRAARTLGLAPSAFVRAMGSKSAPEKVAIVGSGNWWVPRPLALHHRVGASIRSVTHVRGIGVQQQPFQAQLAPNHARGAPPTPLSTAPRSCTRSNCVVHAHRLLVLGTGHLPAHSLGSVGDSSHAVGCRTPSLPLCRPFPLTPPPLPRLPCLLVFSSTSGDQLWPALPPVTSSRCPTSRARSTYVPDCHATVCVPCPALTRVGGGPGWGVTAVYPACLLPRVPSSWTSRSQGRVTRCRGGGSAGDPLLWETTHGSRIEMAIAVL
jgi:hypothetical protein